MAYKIIYKKSVASDFKKIEISFRAKIYNKIEKTLSKNPESGTNLKGNFKGLKRHRIGKYRVVYTVLAETVMVLKISHRKDIYK